MGTVSSTISESGLLSTEERIALAGGELLFNCYIGRDGTNGRRVLQQKTFERHFDPIHRAYRQIGIATGWLTISGQWYFICQHQEKRCVIGERDRAGYVTFGAVNTETGILFPIVNTSDLCTVRRDSYPWYDNKGMHTARMIPPGFFSPKQFECNIRKGVYSGSVHGDIFVCGTFENGAKIDFEPLPITVIE